jgi:lipopolysaccharide biosynthesis regulator YciM
VVKKTGKIQIETKKENKKKKEKREMKKMIKMDEQESREVNGGRAYRCRICGYTSGSYWSTYANALKCVTRKYGGRVLSIASYIFG